MRLVDKDTRTVRTDSIGVLVIGTRGGSSANRVKGLVSFITYFVFRSHGFRFRSPSRVRSSGRSGSPAAYRRRNSWISGSESGSMPDRRNRQRLYLSRSFQTARWSRRTRRLNMAAIPPGCELGSGCWHCTRECPGKPPISRPFALERPDPVLV